MNSREQFEQWASKENNWFVDRNSFGEYVYGFTRDAWAAWQASRAGVEVSFDFDEWPTSIALDIQRAIEAAGLKVKPC